MKTINYSIDENKIVHMVMDRDDSKTNIFDKTFAAEYIEFVEKFLTDDEAKGLIIRSTKSTFFAGGDINYFYQCDESHSQEIFDFVENIKAAMRKLETCGKPLVSCINGAALGGGFEIALTTHHRIALNSRKVILGLPEVSLGLLPGGGGVTRMTRLLGLEQSLALLTEGKKFNPQKGAELGLIDDIVEDESEFLGKATQWILNNESSRQVYDVKGYKIPGGTPATPALAQKLAITPALMRKKTAGCFPAPEAILAAATEGLQVDFETASRIESRYFVDLIISQVSKNLINTFWYQLNEINAGKIRPANIEKTKFTKVGVIGAGMMGAGIALVCANKGIEVVLKDVNQDQADKGKQYAEKYYDKRIKRGQATEAQKAEKLSLIKATIAAEDLSGCELIVEAVFENQDLKFKVIKEAEQYIVENGIMASNTSTLPITGLSDSYKKQDDFIGLHFFSPVERMPLVEIICGDKTSDETLARSYDFVQQIGKTPIVVNDSRGFYTSRVFTLLCREGASLLGEGVAPAAIENAAVLAGYPVGPLALLDEVTITLLLNIKKQAVDAGETKIKTLISHPGDEVLEQMVALDRPSRLAGAGFYEYPEDGNKYLWPELLEKLGKTQTKMPLQDIKDRMLFAQSIDSIRCLEEGVLRHERDANIGSIMGIGFPQWTGGAIQFAKQYGQEAFIARASELATKYGERFVLNESQTATFNSLFK